MGLFLSSWGRICPSQGYLIHQCFLFNSEKGGKSSTEEDKTGRLVALGQYRLITSRNVREELHAVQEFVGVWIETKWRKKKVSKVLDGKDIILSLMSISFTGVSALIGK